MNPTDEKSGYRAVLLLLAFAIFIIDLMIPLGLIVWLIYIPLIFLSLFFKNKILVIRLSILTGTLIMAGYLIPLAGFLEFREYVPWWISFSNRIFGVVVIAIFGYISCRLLMVEDRISRMEKLIKVCAWTRKIMVDGKWLTIEEFMKKYLDKDVTHGISPEAYEKVIKESNLSEDNDRL